MLDKLPEEDRIWTEAISGASAGALSAVAMAQGFREGGAPAAGERMAASWRAIDDSARPISPHDNDTIWDGADLRDAFARVSRQGDVVQE